MKRSTAKKAVARSTQRKARSKSEEAPRRQGAEKTARRSVPSAPAALTGEREICQHCAKDLEHEPRALFVEQEVGRLFCSEECITGFFATEIQHLEREYFQRLSDSDLTAKERVSLAHLRWATLEKPDEIWRERTLGGDSRYTLISKFNLPERAGESVWSVCICLFLNDEPSFLYLAFPTRNAAMVEYYRSGEPYLRGSKRSAKQLRQVEAPIEQELVESRDSEEAQPPTDRLGAPWTEDETYRAQLVYERRDDDIPPEEFGEFQQCLEPTLDEPDEIWSYSSSEHGRSGSKIYHFIKRFQTEEEGGSERSTWFIIMAKESEESEQIEILDAFPTRDPGLVDRHRHGKQETGTPGQASIATVRLVH